MDALGGLGEVCRVTPLGAAKPQRRPGTGALHDAAKPGYPADLLGHLGRRRAAPQRTFVILLQPSKRR
jgi:hypothetical protein